jgi:hypothetical protein
MSKGSAGGEAEGIEAERDIGWRRRGISNLLLENENGTILPEPRVENDQEKMPFLKPYYH